MNFFQQLIQSRHFKSVLIIVFLTISGIAWLGLKEYRHFYITTDDAYVNANVVQVSPRITGKVMQLYVNNNQYVKKDQPLFDIDPEPFQLAVHSAQAQLAMSNAELENALQTKDRTLALVPKKFLSQQDGDNAVANYKASLAKVALAKAALAQAELNLNYTRMTAPTSGWVTNVTLRTGNVVTANQPLFALISDEEFWVDANFKETEMEAIKSQQKAIIKTDLYPHHTFTGVVESISGSSGAAFSLLPPQNATGNWVKVTQRIPVRVRVLAPEPSFPLRVGISATVTIHLKEKMEA